MLVSRLEAKLKGEGLRKSPDLLSSQNSEKTRGHLHNVQGQIAKGMTMLNRAAFPRLIPLGIRRVITSVVLSIPSRGRSELAPKESLDNRKAIPAGACALV
jgi:hypothetical protein